MCFAPQADLVGGIAISAIGIDAVRHVDGRNERMALAWVPLVLGAHQLDEAFVWWGMQGHVPSQVGRVALWIYMLIAFVVLPIGVPAAFMSLEPVWRRRRLMLPFVVGGIGVGAVLLTAMIRGPMTARLCPYHLAYGLELSHGGVIVGLYVTAVCGTLLLSSYRHVFVFGVANLIAVLVLARLTIDGFASIWCAYAAVISGAIALHMRFAKSHRERSYALT